jgi:hypothetical protein
MHLPRLEKAVKAYEAMEAKEKKYRLEREKILREPIKLAVQNAADAILKKHGIRKSRKK